MSAWFWIPDPNNCLVLLACLLPQLPSLNCTWLREGPFPEPTSLIRSPAWLTVLGTSWDPARSGAAPESSRLSGCLPVGLTLGSCSSNRHSATCPHLAMAACRQPSASHPICAFVFSPGPSSPPITWTNVPTLEPQTLTAIGDPWEAALGPLPGLAVSQCDGPHQVGGDIARVEAAPEGWHPHLRRPQLYGSRASLHLRWEPGGSHGYQLCEPRQVKQQSQPLHLRQAAADLNKSM